MGLAARTTRTWTIIVTLLAIVSACLGFGRESYIAYVFGASGLTDAFYVAAIIPDLVAGVIGSALTNAFLPVLREQLERKEDSAGQLINAVFWSACAALASMALGTYLFRGPLIHKLAPGFSVVEHNTAVHMLTVLILSIVFCGLSGILAGVHNAYGRFLYPALTGITSNVLFIGVAGLLMRECGALALAYGLLSGFAGRCLMQVVALLRVRQLWIPRRLWHPAMPRICRALLPIFLASGLESINLIVDRLLASTLPAGQITILNAALKLGELPYSLVGLSMAATVYTRLVSASLAGNSEELKGVLRRSMGWMVFLGTGIMVGYLVFSGDIMAVLFRHGAFTTTDVQDGAAPLMIYGTFTIAFLLRPVLTRFFFASHQNRAVLWISVCAIAVNIMGSVLMVRPLGIVGLALSNSLSQLVHVTSMSFLIMRRLKLSPWSHMRGVCRFGLPAGLSISVGPLFVRVFWHPPLVLENSMHLVYLVISGMAGGVGLVVYSKFVKNDEISQVVRHQGNVLWRNAKLVFRTACNSATHS